jgi:acyl-CoA dehydrogenase
VYLSDDPEDVTGSVEYALRCVLSADAAERKLKETRRQQPYGMDYATWLQQLTAENVLSKEEANLLLASADATRRVVMVDDFPNDMLQGATAGKRSAEAVTEQ